MGFVQLNVNPVNNIVGDCVIRGISFLLKQDWDETYLDIVSLGFPNMNPQQVGMDLLNSGKMSPADFQRFSAIANRLTGRTGN